MPAILRPSQPTWPQATAVTQQPPSSLPSIRLLFCQKAPTRSCFKINDKELSLRTYAHMYFFWKNALLWASRYLIFRYDRGNLFEIIILITTKSSAIARGTARRSISIEIWSTVAYRYNKSHYEVCKVNLLKGHSGAD